MDFLPEDIQRYTEEHTEKESALLNELTRETHKKVLMSRMISGHLQGRVLSMLSHMIRPERVLEIGTFTGYSALCLAEGLAEGGKLITIDKNEELETMAREFIAKAGFEEQIDYLVGDAMELVPEVTGPLDLVFIDADKINTTITLN
jgi:predicted O-methyltransferase YrrM